MNQKTLGGKLKNDMENVGAKLRANGEALGDKISAAQGAVAGKLKAAGQAIQQTTQQGVGAVQAGVSGVVKDLDRVSRGAMQSIRKKVSKSSGKGTQQPDEEALAADAKAAEVELAVQKLKTYISNALVKAGVSADLRKQYSDGLAFDCATAYIKQRRRSLVNALKAAEAIAAGRGAALLNTIDDNKVSRIQANDKRKNAIRNEMERLSVESINEFSEAIATLLNTDALAERFKSESFGVTGKKLAAAIVRFVQDETQAMCLELLDKKASILSTQTQKFVEAYTESQFVIDAPPELTQAAIKCESLTEGVLDGLVLPPVGWEKIAAKKIVLVFDENDLSGNYRVQIRAFWAQKEDAFNQLISTLDEAWAAYLEDLRRMANTAGPGEITRRILSLKTLIKLYDDIEKGAAYA